jgi:methylase of polypeptide subunit release factors
MVQKNLRFLRTLSKDFFLMTERKQKDNIYIVSDNLDLCIKTKHDGYIPKSGLLLTDYLWQIDLDGMDILDLGRGETGILAHYAFARGAYTTGVDIDPLVINHVRNSSNRSDKITWIISDLFSGLNGCRFDMVVSNPPQMPMPFEKRKKLKDWHDSSGNTGRETIVRILETASLYLNANSEILILIFDFLGVKERFSSFPSIEELGYQNNFSCEIVGLYPKTVRRGGQTEKNIPWIQKIYPEYNFGKNVEGNYYYNILIVKFRK